MSSRLRRRGDHGTDAENGNSRDEFEAVCLSMTKSPKRQESPIPQTPALISPNHWCWVIEPEGTY